MRLTRGACLAAAFGALLAAGACDSELERDASDQPCPCSSGYVCDEASNRCVREIGVDSGGAGGSSGETGVVPETGGGGSDGGAPELGGSAGVGPGGASSCDACPTPGHGH